MFKNYGDITKIDVTSVEDVDCIIGGSPCFPSGTLVLTSKGFVNIENIHVGDLVYTHKHRFRKVIAIGSHEDSVISIKGNLSDFFCTPNHPIYSPDVLKVWDQEHRRYQRHVGEDNWVSACCMDHRYWHVPNTFLDDSCIENKVSIDEANAYFFGRWLGDGWCRVGRRKNRKNGTFATVVLCDSLDKEQELIKCCSCMTDKFSVEHQKSCVRIKFHKRTLCNLLENNFGHGAKNKTIPLWLLFSSHTCREALLQGLIDSDGCKLKDKICYSTCSKPLAFSVRLLGESLGYSTSLFFSKGKGHSLIDGRKVLRTDYWMVSLTKSKKKPRFEYNGNSLYLVREICSIPESRCVVYNLSVDEDESYVADSIIVHNCQNLSIAGNKTGLQGSESRLFLEQMRLIKEMRIKTNNKKPRYMVWENVVNALSCSNGKDFQRVLMECVNVAVKTSISRKRKEEIKQSIPIVPMPKDGKWPKSGILYDDLGGWSIAWRVHDAQYWGVAQRRRRIALVVDFAGLTAPEVLFESKSMSGDINKSYTQRERTSERTIGSITESSEQSYIYDARGNGSGKLASTLTGDHDNRVTDYTNVVLQKEPYLLESNQNHATINNDGICTTLPASMGMGGGYVPMITQKYYDTIENKDNSNLTITENKNHKIETIFKESVFVKDVHKNQSADINLSSVAYPLTTGGGKPCQSYPCICIGNGQDHVTNNYTKEISQTLNCMHDPMTILEPIPLEGNGARESHRGNGFGSSGDTCFTLNTVERHCVCVADKEDSFLQKNFTYCVRRLTPLECTRLQGFPDGWVDIGDWVDSKGKKHKDADTPKYKALGNSIALPFWKWLCKNIVNKIKEQYKDSNYIPTMASLFAGIGGFDLCWTEATGNKDSVLWVSEIEEFPIAVLKYHFS